VKIQILLRKNLFLIVLAALIIHSMSGNRWYHNSKEENTGQSRQLQCGKNPCLKKFSVHVSENRPGFPSFWSYGSFGPIDVSYDKRAIRLNGSRALFIGGSMHPGRATRESWITALDEAVRNGLNLITIYVFWSEHQPFPDSPYN